MGAACKENEDLVTVGGEPARAREREWRRQTSKQEVSNGVGRWGLGGCAVGGVWTDAPNQRRQSKDGSSQRGG